MACSRRRVFSYHSSTINTHRLVRRPKKLRIPSQGEEIIVCRCNKCHSIGHNRVRCKNQFFYALGETSWRGGDGDASCH